MVHYVLNNPTNLKRANRVKELLDEGCPARVFLFVPEKEHATTHYLFVLGMTIKEDEETNWKEYQHKWQDLYDRKETVDFKEARDILHETHGGRPLDRWLQYRKMRERQLFVDFMNEHSRLLTLCNGVDFKE